MSQTLVITGASQGIGKAIASKYLENCWKVINVSRNKCPVPKVLNIETDLSEGNYDLIKKFLYGFITEPARICLVHNACRYHKDKYDSIEKEELRKVLEVNVVAPLLLNKLLIPKMLSNSSVIYIGSTLSVKAVPGALSYVTSKHASVGMMRATCQDLISENIHTCCICPGFTDTETLRKRLGSQEVIDNVIGQLVGKKRLILPAEIVDLVYFCANSPVVNGAVIDASLGQIER